MTINNYPTRTTTTVFTDNVPAMDAFRADSHLLGLRFEVLSTLRPATETLPSLEAPGRSASSNNARSVADHML